MNLILIIATFILSNMGSLASEANESVHSDNNGGLDAGLGIGLRVVPIPTRYTSGTEVLCISPNFEIQFDKSLKGKKLPKDLIEATKRTERSLWANRHQYLSVQRGAEYFTSSNTEKRCEHSLTTLRVVIEQDGDGEVRSIMDSAIRPAEERPDLERYTLSVPLSGPAVLQASTALGILRGLTTFENMFYNLPNSPRREGNPLFDVDLGQVPQIFMSDNVPSGAEEGEKTEPGISRRRHGVMYAPAAPYWIEDKPAFGWRAVMLDTSRNYFSKKSIFKVIHSLEQKK